MKILNRKRLFILPGGGDPETKDYRKGFDLIKSEAFKRGYLDVETFKYPGHVSLTGYDEVLQVHTAREIVLNRLIEEEKKEQLYDVYCRSYGCGVMMDILLNTKLEYLERITLWGPSPILNIYKVSVFDTEGIQKAKSDKGCCLSELSYTSTEPFEIQLMKYKGSQKINIGAGSLDTHSKPVFKKFLCEYIKDKSRFDFKTIKNLKHEVTEYNRDYINLIFG